MKKKQKKIRFLPIVLACAMLLPSMTMQAAARTSSDCLTTDDLSEITMEPIAESETMPDGTAIIDDTARTVDTPGQTSSTTTAADETEYDEDIYASYDGYNSLSTVQKKIYDNFKKLAHQYYTGTGGTTEITSSSGVTLTCLSAVSTNSTSLSTSDVAQVVSLFRADNPIYFFLGSGVMYSTSTKNGTTTVAAVYLSVDDAFTDSDTCQDEREVLEETIETVLGTMTDCGTALEYVQTAHDWITDAICYAYDENGDAEEDMIYHSIVGVFDDTYSAAVCEGYAKAFQLLLNAVDVDNYYIVGIANGGGHAWNMARMDDGFYYYFDVTWDDSTSSTTYFAAGETSFSKKHTPDTIDNTGFDFLYDLPDVPDAGYDGSSGTAYTSGDFAYMLYADYAVLTEYLGDDTTVTIPDSADGLPVTQIQGAFANDANLQEVVIPDSVTIISYGDDSTGAFEECVSLKTVTLTDSLQCIYYAGFYDCSALETVVIPASVTRIGAKAFDACNSLGSLYVYGTDCVFGSSSSVYADTVLYGYSDSTTETFADTYDRTFYVIDGTETSVNTTEVTTTTETTTIATATTTTEITTTETTTTTTTTEAATTAETTVVTETETTIDSTTATVTSTTTETTAASTTLRTASASDLLMGDLDGSGSCNLSDVVLLNRYLIGTVTLSSVSTAQLDCYQDGIIDVQDSVAILKFLLRIVDSLPIIPA